MYFSVLKIILKLHVILKNNEEFEEISAEVVPLCWAEWPHKQRNIWILHYFGQDCWMTPFGGVGNANTRSCQEGQNSYRNGV